MSEEDPRNFGFDLKPHGILGILLILFAEVALVLQQRFYFAQIISVWTTPICWWGYIMLLDSIIFYFKKESVMVNYKKRFLVMLFLSILFWIIFEAYNTYLKNWRYIGLPRNHVIAAFGMALSFATILPGIFFTAEILDISKIFERIKIAKLKVSTRLIYLSLFLGICLLTFPLLVKQYYAKYLFAFVWMGFLFLLEPINYSSGAESFLRDLEKGELNRILSFFVAGYICGILWEFWNFWAASKWIYMAPFTQNVKIFEMPLAGFLGFGPFAWEYFSMYNFTRLFTRKRQTRS